jgi:hypothetical protein
MTDPSKQKGSNMSAKDYTPGPSGIKRLSAHLNRHKKRAKHEANVRARATFYTAMDKEVTGAKLGEWHTTLFALSAGTAT